MKKKILITISLLYFPCLFVYVRLTSIDPVFFKKEAIELVLQDKDTKRPIAGALVHVPWVKRVGGSFGGPGFATIKEMWIMSDKDGIVNIPEFKSTHFFSTFESAQCSIYYPLTVNVTFDIYDNNSRFIEYGCTIQELGFKKIIFMPIKSLGKKHEKGMCIVVKKKDKFKLNCNKEGESLLTDLNKSRWYYRELEVARLNIQNFNKDLIPDSDEIEKFHELLLKNTFSQSPFKYGKDFKSYEIYPN